MPSEDPDRLLRRSKRAATRRTEVPCPRLAAVAGLAVIGMLAAAPAAAQTAPQQFVFAGKRHLTPAAGLLGRVVCGDVDGDGDADLVIGNGAGQNRLHRNDGTGIFADVTATHLPALADATSALALGDVDGDGDLDLVVGNTDATNGAQNRLLRNSGSGIFSDATATSLPAMLDRTASVALGDVDGDGDLDLVFGNGHSAAPEQSRLLLNDGTGSFADATATNLPAVGDAAVSVALGDVDGDGDLDLVVGNSGLIAPVRSRLCLNDGSGIYTDATATNLPSTPRPTSSIALGDVDGDGDLDLVVGNYAWNSNPAPFLAGGTQNDLYLNDGSGVFANATATNLPTVHDRTLAVALCDVDADGDLDLVVGNHGPHGEQNRIHLNDGGGLFTDATASSLPTLGDATRSIRPCDVDGDGDLDLVAGNDSSYHHRTRISLNDGNGVFTDATAAHVPPTALERSEGLALVDVDADDDLDLVVANFHGQNRLLRNDGSGGFTDATATGLPPRGDATTSVAAGDVDGDGDADLFFANGWGHFGAEQSRLLRNDGSGTFSDATATSLPSLAESATSAAFADVDGDGDLDLVVGVSWAQSRLLVNDGSGSFSDATATQLPTIVGSTTCVAFADIDGDGDPDLLVGNLAQQNRLYRNDGTGNFTDATASLPTIVDDTRCIAAGDVDGDGDVDLVVGNGSLGSSLGLRQNRLLRNDGSGTFSDATATSLPAVLDATSSLGLADVDGDGDLDLLVGNHDETQPIRLLRNDGSGTFADVASTHLPTVVDPTKALAIGDVDGDGDVDLVTSTGWAFGPCHLYLNLHRQLDAPHALRVAQPFTLEVHARNAPSGSTQAAVVFLSLTRVSIPAPPYGTLGITADAGLGWALIPPATGVASFVWNVPNVATIAGTEVFAQAMILSSSGVDRLTNVTADTVLR